MYSISTVFLPTITADAAALPLGPATVTCTQSIQICLYRFDMPPANTGSRPRVVFPSQLCFQLPQHCWESNMNCVAIGRCASSWVVWALVTTACVCVCVCVSICRCAPVRVCTLPQKRKHTSTSPASTQKKSISEKRPSGCFRAPPPPSFFTPSSPWFMDCLGMRRERWEEGAREKVVEGRTGMGWTSSYSLRGHGGVCEGRV